MSVPPPHLHVAESPPCPTCALDQLVVRPPEFVRVLKTCPICRENFAPKIALTGRRGIASRGTGVIFCSRDCTAKFYRDVGDVDPLLHDFGLPNARVDRRCKNCETPLAPSDRLERCRMCRLTEKIRTRFRHEAKRNAAFRQLRDAHRVYVRRYGARPMEIIE